MKTCGFRALVADEKNKKYEQTQIADTMQATSVLYLKKLEAVTQHYNVSWSGVASESSAPMIPLRLRPRDMQHFETKTI